MVALVALSALWLVLAFRLPSLRGSAQQRATTLAFLCFAVSGTLSVGGVRASVGSLSGIPDVAILLGHLSALLGVAFFLELGVGAWRRLVRAADAVFGSAAVAMVVLFAHIPRRQDEPDFGYWHATAPEVVAYQALFQLCLAAGLGLAGVMLSGQARAASRGPLRTALRLLWLGTAIGLVYVGFRVWYVLAHGFALVERAARPVYGAVTSLLLYAALLSAGVAALIRVGHQVTVRLCRQVAYHHLADLWAEVTAVVPTAVLEPPPHPLVALVSIRTVELRLYRRVVEIRDAQLAVTGHVPLDVRETARAELRSRGVEDDVALDACVLRIGLALARRGGQPPERPSTPSWPQDPSLDAEAAGLAALADATRDPAVVEAADAALRTTAGRDES
ncbi:MAB_1171c family putative transporter [Actinosynnema sp. NPDC023658]|uniref:MAB_1171c family putative transporter n=1 Tax=Actinosynnema sp. NPDC023658 TaxID=3155465 RepID=UPI0033ED6DC2